MPVAHLVFERGPAWAGVTIKVIKMRVSCRTEDVPYLRIVERFRVSSGPAMASRTTPPRIPHPES